jgi:hypothetical protein
LVPALTDLNLPPGGLDWPLALRPQQVTAPVVRRPQLCELPALTAVNVPGGGVAWPAAS